MSGVNGWLHQEPTRTLSFEDFVVILPEENGGGGGDDGAGGEEYCLDHDAANT